MSGYDRDIGWMTSARMAACTCKHLETSHRPISRKCSLCSCPAFTPVAQKKPTDPPVSE